MPSREHDIHLDVGVEFDKRRLARTTRDVERAMERTADRVGDDWQRNVSDRMRRENAKVADELDKHRRRDLAGVRELSDADDDRIRGQLRGVDDVEARRQRAHDAELRRIAAEGRAQAREHRAQVIFEQRQEDRRARQAGNRPPPRRPGSGSGFSGRGFPGLGVPGVGTAGLALGTPLVIKGLVDVAGAAVTASQSIALLPAALTAAAAGFGTLKLGMVGFGDAMDSLGDAEKFAESLQRLSGNAQQAALEIRDLVQGPLRELQQVTQDRLFEGVAEQLHDVTNAMLPSVQRLTTGVAGALNDAFHGVATELMDPSTLASIDRTFGNIAQAFENLAPAAPAIVDSFVTLAEAGSEFLPDLASGFADAAKGFADFLHEASRNGDLATFIDRGVQAVGVLIDVVGDVGTEIFEAFGNRTPAEFRATLDSIVNTAETVADVMVGIADATGTVLNAVKPVAEALGGWENLILAAAGAFVVLKTGGAIATVASLAGALGMGAGGVGGSLAAIPGLAGAAAAALGPVAAIAATLAAAGWGANELSKWLARTEPFGPAGLNTPPFLPNSPTTPNGSPAPGVIVPPGVGQERTPTVNGVPSIGGIPMPGLSPNQAAPPGANNPGDWQSQVRPNPARREGVAPFSLGPDAGLGPFAPKPLPPVTGSSSAVDAPKPVVPYPNTDPMSLLGGAPATASTYSAAQAVLEAEHRVAQERAELAALQADNNAREEDITQARNELVKAEQDRQEAELRLNEARKSAMDSGTRQLQVTADSMDKIGAQLDNDLGLSKGLPGLADNLVRFLASLAFAPAMGALSAVKQWGTAQAGLSDPGSGLLGMALPPVSSGRDSMGLPSTGVSPYGTSPYGMSAQDVDAALLSRVPSGRYSQTGNADLVKGLGDCSSSVEDLVNLLDGQPTGGRSMSTHNAAEWLTARGFVPGMGGPGDFRVGFNSGHMQATLPGGTPFNWGSDASAARGGVGGTGAGDPAFTQHYYRPVARSSAPTPAYVPPVDIYSPANTNPALTNPTPALGNPVGTQTPGLGNPGGVTPGGGGDLFPTFNPAAISQQLNQQQQPIGYQPGQGGFQPAGGGFAGLGGAPMGAIQGAISAAGSAAAPFGGQAAAAGAQMLMQILNRTAGFAGQAAAIGVQGLGQTFLPAGSALGDMGNNIFGKIAAGFAGARPAQATSAGKQDIPDKDLAQMLAQGRPNEQPPGVGGAAGRGDAPLIGNMQVQDPKDGQKIAREVQFLNAYGSGQGR